MVPCSRARSFLITKRPKKGESLCHVVMEQDRREKAPVPAKVWAPVVVEKEKVAVKAAAANKAVVVDASKAKVKPVERDSAVGRISE